MVLLNIREVGKVVFKQVTPEVFYKLYFFKWARGKVTDEGFNVWQITQEKVMPTDV